MGNIERRPVAKMNLAGHKRLRFDRLSQIFLSHVFLTFHGMDVGGYQSPANVEFIILAKAR